MILETGIISATNTDVMSAGRLNAIPYSGTLTIDLLSQLADATNFYTVSIQLPNGDVPVDGQLVPGANPALAGILDERQLMRMSFRATQGGHYTVSLTESGTAVCAYRFVLRP